MTSAAGAPSLDAVVLRRVSLVRVDADTDGSSAAPSVRRRRLLAIVVKVCAFDRVRVLLGVQVARLFLQRGHRRFPIGMRPVRQR